MQTRAYLIYFCRFVGLLSVGTFLMGCNGTPKTKESKSEGPQRPNFIIIFTDDQGYGDVGVYGAAGFKTPHIDALAREGAMFTDFYMPASVCTPSRAGLLTGAYPKRVGLHEAVLFPFSKTGLNPNEVVLPELLSPLGYTTGCIGKWHLGHFPEFMPTNQGFDFFHGVPYSNDMDGYLYKEPPFQSPPLPIYKGETMVAQGTDQDSLTIRWTNAAKQFITKNKDAPFFLYLAHNMPHLPWHVSGKFKNSSERGIYGDVIQEIDWSVGQIMAVLEENDLDDNTVLIFTSDNGPVTHLENGGSAGPLRGAKATTWEGGMRVPCIVRWPKRIKPGTTISEIATAMDFYPTIASLAGIEDMGGHTIDGHDMSALLFGSEGARSGYDAFYYYGRNGDLEAIREGDWKLHRTKYDFRTRTYDDSLRLFNLKRDMAESTNVAESYPEIVKRLSLKMTEFDKKITSEARAVGKLAGE
ncbi:MAG: sulfatase [Flavobacteriaceae bacterium]